MAGKSSSGRAPGLSGESMKATQVELNAQMSTALPMRVVGTTNAGRAIGDDEEAGEHGADERFRADAPCRRRSHRGTGAPSACGVEACAGGRARAGTDYSRWARTKWVGRERNAESGECGTDIGLRAASGNLKKRYRRQRILSKT